MKPTSQPNFLMVGASKAGTTSVWEWLRQQPEVFMAGTKEPGYFLREPSVGTWSDYRELFRGARGQRWIGEASTNYLARPEVPRRIFDALGPVKILIVLRNPVQRAYSLYGWMAMEGHEWMASFDEALADEERRMNSGAFRRECWHPWDDFLYFNSGLYFEQVQRYRGVFGPSNVKICFFDDLVTTPTAFYADVADFLGIAPSITPLAPARNVSRLPRSIPRQHRLRLLRRSLFIALRRCSVPATIACDGLMKLNLSRDERSPMSAAARARLVEGYREDVTRLGKLVGRDLSSWLQT